MKFYLSILLLILLIPAFSFAKSPRPKYTIRHFNSVSGLPQNSVSAIAKDVDGFIWLTTFEGLARFDGKNIRTFGKNNLALKTNIFKGFLPDMEGRNDRLYTLTDQFEYIKITSGKPTKDIPRTVERLRSMFKTKEGPSAFSYATGLSDHMIEIKIPSHYLFGITGSNGDFYLWRKDGTVACYSSWKWVKTLKTSIKSPHNLFRLGRKFYYANKVGYVELLTDGLHQETLSRKVKLTNRQAGGSVPNLSEPFYIYPNNVSGEAFLYQDQKLYLLSNLPSGDIETTVILEDYDFEKSNVSSVLFDQTNRRLYLGTLNNGLFILDFNVFETLTVESNEREANIFYAHAAQSDSTVITPSWTVLGISPSGRNIAYRPPGPNEFPMFTRTLVKARSGDIWSVKDSILYHFDSTGRILKRKWNAGGEISHLYEDSEGRIWLGTRFVGLKYIDPREEGIPVHTFSTKITEICYLLNDSKNILWVGTVTGLFKVYLNRNSFSLIPGTEKLWIKSLLKINDELWFTTSGKSIYLLQKEELTRFPLDQNHYLARPHCMVIDQNNFLWIPTNNGLFRMSRQDLLDFRVHRDSTRLYYHRYTQKDGFRIDEFNGGCQPCAMRLRSGYVSLPSMDGMVFFKPELVPVEVPNSKIFIDRIEAAASDVPIHDSQIELSGVSDLKVFVVSPYLGNHENQQLFYTVSAKGKDTLQQTWYPIENEKQFIHLNNLSSGTYILKIRKNAGFGSDVQYLTMLTIVIPYEWYETWLFKLMVIITAMTTSFLYYKSRLKKVTRLNHVLESRVSERTRDLQETLGVLKTSEAELLRQTRLQMHLIASISHDIRSPMRSIEFTSSRLPVFIEKGDHTFAKTIGTSINESSKQILMHLENILSFVKSQLSDSSVVYDTFAIRDLVDEVGLIFNQSITVRQNHFENRIPETLQIRSSRQLLKIILHNLIDNANKFTSEGSIIITADLNPKEITLIVSDTGAGLEDRTLHWFNESMMINPKLPDGEPGIKGIGLPIVKELAEILKIEIIATTGQGTQFIIRFLDQG